MKRKNILNRLKLEMENSMPNSGKIINNVKNAKVEKDLAPVYDAINSKDGAVAVKTKYNVMYISGIMFLTMLLFTLLLTLLPVINSILYPEKNIVTKFGIDINPSIDLMLDENDEVVWVLAKNKHAEVLLSGENFEGQHVKVVADKIIKLAARAGYFSTEPVQAEIANAVMLSAVSENDEKQQSLLEAIKTNVKNFYMNNQIYGVVLTEFDSKQELVDLVCSLDYDLTLEEKEALKDESIKNLNHRLNQSYIQLKRRFKHDLILEEFRKTLNLSNKECDAELANIEQQLFATQNKLDNFETDWLAENEICKQKIAEWQARIAFLQATISSVLNPEEVAELQAELETKLMFVSTEQAELENRNVNGEMFKSNKNKLISLINQYKNDIKQKHEQRLFNMEKALGNAKGEFDRLHEIISERKTQLIAEGDKRFSEHLSNLQNYNDFYNSYSEWLLNTADKIPNLQNNWSGIKQNWEQNYSDFVMF